MRRDIVAKVVNIRCRCGRGKRICGISLPLYAHSLVPLFHYLYFLDMGKVRGKDCVEINRNPISTFPYPPFYIYS
jgi:hypothetical protein